MTAREYARLLVPDAAEVVAALNAEIPGQLISYGCGEHQPLEP
jgi:hypothetical protein